ncbi:ubiquinol oxidase subunit II [Rhizomicrobium electricum]|uniref:Ubiquinol oxidase subunit 2 n=1 Tax=Rhizomicrobium electricum TaxID=480070 RepID=A0ABP3Q428_9PROT|nr:cytochrome o ubiquinol oxidase subunit 2 [Rhizomicrobium electricum]
MSPKSKWTSWIKVGARAATLAVAAVLLSGCDAVLLDPKGPIGEAERDIIYLATGLMLLVVVPVIGMTVAFAWKYRASNTKATYAPNWNHSTVIEAVVWSIPVVIILILGTVTWISSHTLDPRRPIASAQKPLEVQVVSLDWKWLFIYPEYGVASVNELALPVGRPVHFSLTSSGVMNAFFVPQLGTQVYTMPGMQSQLNLRADHAGSYLGISANYSGRGFADMNFKALAMEPAALKDWIARAKAATPLDTAAYRTLAAPGTHSVALYGTVEQGLYDRILNQCALGGICTNEAVSMARIKGPVPKGPLCDPKTGKPISIKS